MSGFNTFSSAYRLCVEIHAHIIYFRALGSTISVLLFFRLRWDTSIPRREIINFIILDLVLIIRFVEISASHSNKPFFFQPAWTLGRSLLLFIYLNVKLVMSGIFAYIQLLSYISVRTVLFVYKFQSYISPLAYSRDWNFTTRRGSA